jgi:hypothetical protein
MAGDGNRGKSGSRGEESSKLEGAPPQKSKTVGSGAKRQGQTTESRENGSTGVPGTDRPPHLSIRSDLADQIGARLRSVYDDVLVQPVPERFMELLRQLESGPAASFAPAKKDST